VLRSYADGSLLGSASGTAVPDVLALHGWARSHRDFDGVVAAVPDTDPAPDPSLDAIALDLPGFGQAPPPPAVWGSPEYATAIAAVMDEMAPTVVVIGHSFGGRVALHLAVRRPDRVRALVLTGVPLFPPDRRAPAAQFRAVRLLHRAGLIGEGRMEVARQRYGSEDYRRAEGVMRQVLVKTLGERYDEQLASIGCPVSLVWGADDMAAPVAMAEAASARLAHATLAVCSGAGHLTPLTVPRVLHHAVRSALG
jgi:pimeloyl-ACP methyl ester carboxylesterase